MSSAARQIVPSRQVALRTVVAAAVAGPLMLVLYAIVANAVIISFGNPGRADLEYFRENWGNALGAWIGAGALVGWPSMLIGGLPAHALLYHYRLGAFWHYALAGAAVGFVILTVLCLLMGYFAMYYPEWLMTGAIGGALAALIFWLIRRPDRDLKATIPA